MTDATNQPDTRAIEECAADQAMRELLHKHGPLGAGPCDYAVIRRLAAEAYLLGKGNAYDTMEARMREYRSLDGSDSITVADPGNLLLRYRQGSPPESRLAAVNARLAQIESIVSMIQFRLAEGPDPRVTVDLSEALWGTLALIEQARAISDLED